MTPIMATTNAIIPMLSNDGLLSGKHYAHMHAAPCNVARTLQKAREGCKD